MQFCRMYTGDDGKSHFEELDQTQGSKFFLSHSSPSKHWFSKMTRTATSYGWHNAPRRQWCITLSGTCEIGIGDGTKKTFGPGDVFLAEDVTGEGHTALPKNWVRAFIHI